MLPGSQGAPIAALCRIPAPSLTLTLARTLIGRPVPRKSPPRPAVEEESDEEWVQCEEEACGHWLRLPRWIKASSLPEVLAHEPHPVRTPSLTPTPSEPEPQPQPQPLPKTKVFTCSMRSWEAVEPPCKAQGPGEGMTASADQTPPRILVGDPSAPKANPAASGCDPAVTLGWNGHS